MNLPHTLGELKKSSFSEQRLRTRKVKDELRENLISRLRTGETIFLASSAMKTRSFRNW